MLELKGKVALVTGAASGIGLSYVKELLRNQLKGVALIDVNAENGQRALDQVVNEFGVTAAIFVRADVSDQGQLEEAFETTVKTFNQLDIVINNAGIMQEIQWEKCVAVNLMGVLRGSMLAMEKYFPKYKSGNEALIVNTGSMIVMQPYEAVPMYTATKFGVVGFTRAMGGDVHYQRTGVRIIAICPGLIETPMINLTTEQISEPYLSMITTVVKETTVRQTPEGMAKSVVQIIGDAPNGSVWMAVGDNCTQLNFPSENTWM